MANLIEIWGRWAERGSAYLLASLLAIGVLIAFINIDGLLVNDDEGIYLYSAWRMGLGEVPYRDFFNSQPPLSFALMGLLFRIFGPSISLARGFTALLVVASSALLYAIARDATGFKLAGVLAVSLYLFNPEVSNNSRFFIPDFYMIALLIAGLYFFTRSYKGGGGWGFVLAGVLWGLSAVAKLFGLLFFGGPLLFFLYLSLTGRRGSREILRMFLMVSGAFVLVAGASLAALFLFVPNSRYGILGYHLAKESLGISLILRRGVEQVSRFVGNKGYALAVFGLPMAILGFFKRRDLEVLMALQLLMVFSLLLLPRPFFLRYLIAAIPLLAVLGVSTIAELSRHRRLLPILAVSLTLIPMADVSSFDPRKFTQWDAGARELVEFIKENTDEGDYVLSDYTSFNFLSGRRAPPRLTDVSETMTLSGQITAEDVIAECERYSVKLILLHVGDGAHHLVNLRDYGRFRDYIGRRYDPLGTRRRWGQTFEVYVRKADNIL
ncbi:MAG: ArnT family glycosyltransferase [bacterium]